MGVLRGVVGVVGAENNGDIEGTVVPFKGVGCEGIIEGVWEAKLGERDGTGLSSGGGDSGSGADVTELMAWLSSKSGRRPMGTPLRYCAGCRRANGSGNWAAVGKDR